MEESAFNVFMDNEYRRLIGEIDARVVQYDLTMNKQRLLILKQRKTKQSNRFYSKGELDVLQSMVDNWFSLNPIQKRDYLINKVEELGGKDTSLFSWWTDDNFINNYPLYIKLMQHKLMNP